MSLCVLTDQPMQAQTARDAEQAAAQHEASIQAASHEAAQAAEELGRVRSVLSAIEEAKAEADAKVARAAGCLKAADELREARCAWQLDLLTVGLSATTA